MPDSGLIDPDIRKARTLPSRYYADEEVFSEIVSGFAECWHFAAHESQLDKWPVLRAARAASAGRAAAATPRDTTRIDKLQRICKRMHIAHQRKGINSSHTE